jgi:hypothetical protein
MINHRVLTKNGKVLGNGEIICNFLTEAATI